MLSELHTYLAWVDEHRVNVVVGLLAFSAGLAFFIIWGMIARYRAERDTAIRSTHIITTGPAVRERPLPALPSPEHLLSDRGRLVHHGLEPASTERARLELRRIEPTHLEGQEPGHATATPLMLERPAPRHTSSERLSTQAYGDERLAEERIGDERIGDARPETKRPRAARSSIKRPTEGRARAERPVAERSSTRQAREAQPQTEQTRPERVRSQPARPERMRSTHMHAEKRKPALSPTTPHVRILATTTDRPLADMMSFALEMKGLTVASWRLESWTDKEIHNAADNTGVVVVVWTPKAAQALRSGGAFTKAAVAAMRREKLAAARMQSEAPGMGDGHAASANLVGWEGDPRDPKFVKFANALADVIDARPERASTPVPNVKSKIRIATADKRGPRARIKAV